MTLDGYALTGLFVVMFGFLCVTAYIFETAQPNPLNPDRRHQAHPIGDYRPATRSGPEQVEVPILDGTRIPVQGRSSLSDFSLRAGSGVALSTVPATPRVGAAGMGATPDVREPSGQSGG